MSDKTPAIVLFKTFGRVIPALVLSSRIEPSHLGLNEEPMLTIAFMDAARETGLKKDPQTGEFVYPFGREPQIFIERDVVHESHEFDEEFLKQHGSSEAQVAAQRGNGEWSEFVGDDAAFEATLKDNASLRNQLRDAQNAIEDAKLETAALKPQLVAAQTEAESPKSRADLAEQLVESLRKELAEQTKAPAPLPTADPENDKVIEPPAPEPPAASE